MAWTTNIETIEVGAGGAASLMVTFVDQAAGHKESRKVIVATPDADSIKAALRKERDAIVTVYAVKTALQPGLIDIDTSSPPVPDDADEAARKAYFQAYNRYRAIKAQVADGVVEQAEADAALAELRKAFKPEFLGVL